MRIDDVINAQAVSYLPVLNDVQILTRYRRYIHLTLTPHYYVFVLFTHPSSITQFPTMISSFARAALRRTPSTPVTRALSGFPAPRLFDYETVSTNLKVSDAITAVEDAFAALARGEVDVPMPMHIGIEESSVAGPGDCHIKGGYVSATPTFTVKLACVSFYKNAEVRSYNMMFWKGRPHVCDSISSNDVCVFLYHLLLLYLNI